MKLNVKVTQLKMNPCVVVFTFNNTSQATEFYKIIKPVLQAMKSVQIPKEFRKKRVLNMRHLQNKKRRHNHPFNVDYKNNLTTIP